MKRELERVHTVGPLEGLWSAEDPHAFVAPYAEGTSVQILHAGSFDSEAPVLARLHGEYLPEHGLTVNGRHHEIYLSDPRRTPPSKLRTILRQPVVTVS